jgi:hypothetical protein
MTSYWKPQTKDGRLTAWTRRIKDGERIARLRREALENGGPEKLDVAALKERLGKKENERTDGQTDD